MEGLTPRLRHGKRPAPTANRAVRKSLLAIELFPPHLSKFLEGLAMSVAFFKLAGRGAGKNKKGLSYIPQRGTPHTQHHLCHGRTGAGPTLTP